MGFTFNSATGANYTPIFTEVAKQEVKVVPPKVVYRVEITNLPKLIDRIKLALQGSHPRFKHEIKIRFEEKVCRVYFRDTNKTFDSYSLFDVKKTRIAVK